MTVPVRPYVSARRAAAAAEKRDNVLDTARRLLDEGCLNLSMEAVARAAGVTRLTVYSQFGSRRGLLEAVFDSAAERAGVKGLAATIEVGDPLAGLELAIAILCNLWGNHPMFATLADMAAGDAEFAEALKSRQDRRRPVIATLVHRLPGNDDARSDATDLLCGLISLAMYRELSPGRTPEAVAQLIYTACCATLAAHDLTPAW